MFSILDREQHLVQVCVCLSHVNKLYVKCCDSDDIRRVPLLILLPVF